MNRKKIFIASLAMLVVGLFLGEVCRAISEEILRDYAQNGITIYQQLCTELGGDVSVCNANLPQATIEAMESAGVKERAEQNIERYKYAEEQTGIPWQAVAALHYREAGMASDRSISNGQRLAATGTCYVNVDKITICSDPNQDAKEAAEHLISMAKWVYDVDLTASSTVEEWGQAFLAYNRGVIYKRNGVDWKESPYPMNGFDEEHALWMQRPWVENTAPMYLTGRDLNVGALAIFAYLCGSGNSSTTVSSSASSGSTTLNSDITLIGDSIAVGSGDKLRLKFPGSFFTMVISRHPTAKGMCSDDEGGLAILKKIVSKSGTIATQNTSGTCTTITIDENSLKDNVVWELGANAVGATEATIEEVISEVGNRNLFLVTPYDGNNQVAINSIAEMYRSVAERYDNVYVVDWNAEMQDGGAATYLSSDKVHPNSAGQDLLVELIAEAIEGAQDCTIDIKSDAYQERLSNLHKFNQSYYKKVGTWWNYTMCVKDYQSKKISGHGCGVMSLYAAYYMFTGKNLDDEVFFTNLRSAMQQDGYIGSECDGTNEEGYGEKTEELTGIKLEKVWGDCGVDCYKDDYWNLIVEQLQKGNKILLATAGSGVGGSSEFAGNYHATMLDHYDASRDMVYFFDPVYENYHDGIEYASNSSDGAYVSREAMEKYIRPISGYAMIYKDSSCYNICESVGGSETTPIYPLDDDSIDIPCARGTTDYDTYVNPSWRGKKISIRLCKVDNLPSNGQDDPGFAIVNSRVSGAFYALAARAQSEGVDLIASSSFRTYERQHQFCYDYGWCATGRAAQPGSSMHELGLAVDFNGTCGFGVSPASCDATGSKISLWLRDNVEDFELYRPLTNEAWHVQPLLDGGGS